MCSCCSSGHRNGMLCKLYLDMANGKMKICFVSCTLNNMYQIVKVWCMNLTSCQGEIFNRCTDHYQLREYLISKKPCCSVPVILVGSNGQPFWGLSWRVALRPMSGTL